MLQIQAVYEVAPYSQCIFYLPRWRPGRYEAANYAKNVRNLRFEDSSGTTLAATKPQHSSWRVDAGADGKIIATYEYFAFKLDAGQSWVDEDLCYINFVNCLIYEPSLMHQPCEVALWLDKSFTIATSLTSPSHGKLQATDYYQLVDSPLLAARKLQKIHYMVGEVDFYIWSWGYTFPDEDQLRSDFMKFSESQIHMMKEFPEPAYHFLLLILPYKFYHGVEHGASTVICLGPARDMGKEEVMDQLLGVSSHELFHAWNIVTIRPQELFPYKFHEVPYFATGFVAEGFTTYYGDLFLVRSGVKDKKWYLKELNLLFKRHFDNAGRLAMSVVESSYDLWVDGYQKGAPARKSSIYIEGAVTALMLDLTIRLESQEQYSLDDVLQTLLAEFAAKNKGYSLDDIRRLCSEAAGADLTWFFDRFITGTEEKRVKLSELLQAFGLDLTLAPSSLWHERYLGIRVQENDEQFRIVQIHPNSPGEQYFSLEDQLMFVDEVAFSLEPGASPESEPGGCPGLPLNVKVKRMNREKEITLTIDPAATYFRQPQVIPVGDANEAQRRRFQQWLSLEF